MTTENTDKMKIATHIPKRSCHLCGRPCERWCPYCLAKYCGPSRRSPETMTPGERTGEIEQLLSPPYEMPLLAIYKRIGDLLGREIILEDFFRMERMRESEQPRPLFRMKPPQPAANAPTGQMPGVSIGPGAPDPASLAKEWSAVPTLKSFVHSPPGPDSATPHYVPPEQPFPKTPSMEVPVVSLKPRRK